MHSRINVLDGVFLLLFGIYIFAGISLTPFHGDEGTHTFTSSDYATMFIEKQPEKLMLKPPYEEAGEPARYRLIDGSFFRYFSGFVWHVAGYQPRDLPVGFWGWKQDYASNVTDGRRPSDNLLNLMRATSALLLWLSVITFFGIARYWLSRPIIWMTTMLYALNPVILLNGRRMMQEGALLFWSLLTILVAIYIVHHNNRVRWYWWVLLALVSGITLATKISGIIHVAAAFVWIFLRALQDRPLINMIKLIGVTVGTFAVLTIMSPSLWYNPVGHLVGMIFERNVEMRLQIAQFTEGTMAIKERAANIVTQPFLTPPQYFEDNVWAAYPEINAEIATYEQSIWYGILWGKLLGAVLTLLAGMGLLVAMRKAVRNPLWRGFLGWLALNIVILMLNPLPWQRYYLALIPSVTLLTGFALEMIYCELKKRAFGG